MTSIMVNDDLLSQVLQLSGFQDKKQAVHVALEEYIAKKQKKEIINLFNSIDYMDNYDYKEGRNRGLNYEDFS